MTRLQARMAELSDAAWARTCTIADPAEVGDSEYVLALKDSVDVALGYGLAAIESSEQPPPVPEPLLSQARYAARVGVPLATVLRRYCGGYSLLGQLSQQEAEQTRNLESQSERVEAHRALSTAFDLLLGAVAEAHTEERETRLGSPESRCTQRLRRVLCGELADSLELEYELERWHLALVVSGTGATGAVNGLARALGSDPLLARPERSLVWAWLGSARRMSSRETQRLATSTLPPGLEVAIGEAGHGLAGWRLSHRQASAAMTVIHRRPERVLRYVDVSLLASAIGDDVLASSLKQTYIAPLRECGGDPDAILDTVTAYLESNRNASSAAALLRVNRQTVSNRLRAVERAIGRTVDSCAAELRVALELDGLQRPRAGREGPSACW